MRISDWSSDVCSSDLGILKAFKGKVQLGGGIRDRAAIDRWLSLGVHRVVIGTAALENPELIREAARDYPGRIVVAVDAKDGMVATRGWADVSTITDRKSTRLNSSH